MYKKKYKPVIHTAILFLTLTVLSCTVQKSGKDKNLTNYVNPFIRTATLLDSAMIGYTQPKDWIVWAGLVFPGSSVPNAMVQLSPMTKYGSGAEYEYEDT